MSSTVVHSSASYDKTCKHTLRAGERLGELCGKSCTFDAYCQRVEYCASHYAWNLINPNPLPPRPSHKRNSHPTYKQMIFGALKHLDPLSNGKTSAIAIRKYIHTYYTVSNNANHCIRLALRCMVNAGEIIPIAASYRLVKPTSKATQEWLE